MFTVYAAVTVIAIAANLGIVVADFARAPSVLANAAEVRMPPRLLPVVAVLKAAGAAGLLIGLLGAPRLGTAAALGLTLFFACALGAHVRARVFHNIAFPGAYFAVAVAAFALSLTQL
ncbi:DoxX family protein [Actinomadura oligospora]|uniref:DoxX family protein n=1 Tax=Actinomadura oligospora TaxID=111804 RepID=UPI00047BE8D2|nr:DoxX family protein [Actinomadura oligospora]